MPKARYKVKATKRLLPNGKLVAITPVPKPKEAK